MAKEYRINSSGAGKDCDAFEKGAKKFLDRHPELDWQIRAGQLYEQPHITVITSDNNLHSVTVAPTLDLAESVFTALEQYARRVS